MKTKITALLLALVMVFAFAACGGKDVASPSPSDTASVTPSAEVSPSPDASPSEEVSAAPAAITEDRMGNPITLPETIEKIMTFGPSNTEVISGLGLGDKIVAADTYSTDITGVSADIPLFEMSAPDTEQIISLDPDVIFVTAMVLTQSDDPYKPLRDAGICIIYMPTSDSINGIKEDIAYIASVLGVSDEGNAMIASLEKDIADIKTIADTITEKKSVYFEISAAPYMYSFGSGVFLNEMIELIGATNVFSDQEAWISVADESILAANPDVILTSVYYLDDPVAEILSRPGWDALTAVKNSDVYLIDANSSNRASQNIVKALKEMSIAVYPEYYK